MLCDFSSFKFIDTCFCPRKFSILFNILCELKKKMYSAVVGCNVLLKSIRLRWLTVLFRTSTSLLIFKIGSISWWQRGVKTANYVALSISVFNSVHFYFMYLETLLLGTHTFMIVRFWYEWPFVIIISLWISYLLWCSLS